MSGLPAPLTNVVPSAAGGWPLAALLGPESATLPAPLPEATEPARGTWAGGCG